MGISQYSRCRPATTVFFCSLCYTFNMSPTAIFDIGSASVGAALVVPSRQGRSQRRGASVCTQIVFATRQRIILQENLELNRFLSNIAGALKLVAAAVVKARLGSPRRLICFLSSPFYAAHTSLIKISRPAPFKITPVLVSELVSGEVERFKKQQAALFESRVGGHEIVENKIIEIKLNGYPFDHPYDKKASEVEIADYLSIASSRVLNLFRRALILSFHLERVEFHSFALAGFAVLGNLFGPGENYIILDLGGEMTEISLVWRGVLWGTASFPLGSNSAVRRLAGEFKTSPAEALSNLHLYLKKRLDAAAAGRVEKTLVTTVKKEWLAAFRQALERLPEPYLLPANVYLVGEEGLAALFGGWLAEEEFVNLFSGGRFSPRLLGKELLGHFCGHPPTGGDLSLMMEAVYCDKILTVV